MMRIYSVFASVILMVSCFSSCNADKSAILFEDSFGPETQGKLRQNIIQLPPPAGLGYKSKVLQNGYDPSKWEMVDEVGPNHPKKGFWVIPPDSAFLQQGGRSGNSVLYCKTIIPEGSESYDINFEQYRNDNDYIGYIIGANEMGLKAGIEFGYMTQVPGSDSTVSDAYLSGAFGEKLVKGMALRHVWAEHRIQVRDGWIEWYINDQLMGSIEENGKSTHGYFGIRQRYERNTRYDNVQIILH